MALFVRNIVRVVALVIVLKGVSISCMALTDSSIACNSDPEACRYDCPAGVIQNHNCTTEKDVHDPVEGKCCPAFFKTENNSTVGLQMVEMQLIQHNELVYLEEELEQYIAAQPGRGL